MSRRKNGIRYIRKSENTSNDHLQKDGQLSQKREIALSAVPRYWGLELRLLSSIKYYFTIFQRVIMTLIPLKTIHTLHHTNQKNKYWRRFTCIFYPMIWWLVINTFYLSYSVWYFRGWCARINKCAYSLFTNNSWSNAWYGQRKPR